MVRRALNLVVGIDVSIVGEFDRDGAPGIDREVEIVVRAVMRLHAFDVQSDVCAFAERVIDWIILKNDQVIEKISRQRSERLNLGKRKMVMRLGN